MAADQLRDRVLALAREQGFTLARIASAEPLLAARRAALERHAAGVLEGMDWITPAWLERSTDPRRFLEGARSVVVVALPAHAPEPAPYRSTGESAYRGSAHPGTPIPAHPETRGAARGRIARYARGRDYHRVFEKKLRRLARAIRDEFGAAARATVDYGPLLERPLAVAAGLGWEGKSTMLLVPGLGPWVLLGAVATTLDLAPDEPLRKSCGSCTRCAVACPTGALGADGRVLDARLCISYHTIENRGPIPRHLRPLFGDWIFGCDDCLDSCPVGAASTATHPGFAPATIDDARPALAPLLALDEAAFAERFRGRAIMRARRDGFLRNVCVALGNVGQEADVPALLRALCDPSPLVRGHAAWALGRIQQRLALVPSPIPSALAARLPLEPDPWAAEEIRLALEPCLTPGA
jgi:epoxyqueuosine reductase